MKFAVGDVVDFGRGPVRLVGLARQPGRLEALVVVEDPAGRWSTAMVTGLWATMIDPDVYPDRSAWPRPDGVT